MELSRARRALFRNRALAFAAISCIAMGIGANAEVFTAIDALFLRQPNGVEAPDEVARVYLVALLPGQGTFITWARSYPEYTRLNGHVPAFGSMAAYTHMRVPMGSGTGSREVTVALASQTLLPLLKVNPQVGRFFLPEEDHPGAAGVAVISDALWSSLFNRDLGVLGHDIVLGGASYSIIGVAQKGFVGIDIERVDVWLPIEASAPSLVQEDALTSPFNGWITIVGRLAKGVRSSVAEQQLTAAIQGTSKRSEQLHAILGPIQEARGPVPTKDLQITLWVGAVAAVVLLIAVTNLVTLLAARAIRRRREVAILMALGGTDASLFRQFTLEGLLLAGVGGGAAMLLVLASHPVMSVLLPPQSSSETSVGPRLLIYVLLSTIFTGLLASLLTLAQAKYLGVGPLLGTGDRGTERKSVVSTGFAVGQVGISVVLLVGAGLFLRSLVRLRSLDLGVNPDDSFVASIDIQGLGLKTPQIDQVYQGVLEQLHSIPSVASASVSFTAPLEGGWAANISLPDREVPRAVRQGYVSLNAVSVDYFAATGTPILRGRAFMVSDASGDQKVAIVNGVLASLLWPGEDPLGKCFRHGDDPDCILVVGVAANVPFHIAAPRPARIYLPFSQVSSNIPLAALEIRVRKGSNIGVETLQRGLYAKSPNLPFLRIAELSTQLADEERPWRLGTTMLLVYGCLAALVTALGLYGLFSSNVSRRTRDIGVRLALGASRRSIMVSVVGEGITLVVVGIGIGMVFVLGFGRVIRNLLYETSPTDPLVVGLVAGLVVAVGTIATIFPAWRAAAVDPVIALRGD